VATIALGAQSFELTFATNDLVFGVPVFSQPGALPARALQQGIAAVREVDVDAPRAEAGARQERVQS
jgi:hypothetical protein